MSLRNPLSRARSRMLAPFLTGVLIAVLGWIAPASAQVPKPGKEYQDTVDLGFRIKMPEGWDFIPPQPNEPNNIGRYTNGQLGFLVNPKTNQGLVEQDIQLLKFDRRKKPGTEEGGDEPEPSAGGSRRVRFEAPVIASFDALMKEHNADWIELPKERKEAVIGKVPAIRRVYKKDFGEIAACRIAYEYKLSPEIDVVMIGTGPGDPKKWGKWESAYESLAKSFRAAELSTKLEGARSGSLRDMKRAELQKEIAKNPGWALYETPNYFIVSSMNDDKQFIDELMERLEAIRAVYEEIYPAALAEELKQLAKIRRAKEAEEKKAGGGEPASGGDGEPEGDGEEPDHPGQEGEDAPPADEEDEAWRTVAEKADAMELSKCSVVRVCKDNEEYHSYGGPGGSAGYWSSWHKELVVFDDKARGGRDNTWATLNHEAFHQYIYYFFGELAPHSWYNEGNGDYFSGYQLEHKKFTVKPFDWRERLVQMNMRESMNNNGNKIVPLQKFVYWSQRDYYGDNQTYNTDGGDHYAQGWSLIYFLRNGKKKAKCWNPSWDTILDTYLRPLVETDDLKAASDAAFAGVDWKQLEKCWMEYILAG